MKNKKILAVLLVFPILLSCCSVSEQLNTNEFYANSNQYIFFLTGDGGYTKATEKFCKQIQAHNYNIISMDARYFYGGKTLTKAVSSFENVVKRIEKKKRIERITVIGYSFGADVTPFIINNIPDSLRNRISEVVLLAPSQKTNLKIDLLSLLFPKQVGKLNVVSEINKIAIPVKVILNEKGPYKELKFNKYITVKILPGNHHFDYNYDLLVKTILQVMNEKNIIN